MNQRVQIRDVASRAGVSLGTVSNVLNGKETVAPDIVTRVRAAVDELGFVRNDNARQLRAGGSRTISLLVLSNFNPFFTALADAAEDEAEKYGYSVVLASSAQKATRESKYIELFEEQRSRGILLAPIDGVTPNLDRVHARGMPIILLGQTGPKDRYCCVAADAESGGYLAARHLLQGGRRRIAIVGGPLFQVRDRVEGARRAIKEVPGASELYLATPDLTQNDGRVIGAQIADMPTNMRPDGIFAANDLLAIGIVEALLATSRVSVPQDISIVGHGDIEFANSALIPLTTVREPIGRIAAAAIRLCIREADEGVVHDHEQLMFTPELVVRHSSL